MGQIHNRWIYLRIPEMGIKGAALATVLATVVQFLWSVGYVLCRIRAVKFRSQKL